VRTEGRLGGRRVQTLFLQPLAADQRRIWRYLPLFPLAAERLPVAVARVVMASSSAFAHGVTSAADAVDVSYCYSPSRYVWHERDRTERGVLTAVRPAARAVLGSMRQQDIRAAARVTGFIGISELTHQRIREFYGRDAIIVHPPVDVGLLTREPDPRDYLLTIGEATRHKNTELALAAAARAGAKIKVVGDGPDVVRLR
jgi:glycosyltransferase involved in cell wall biosynthesis